jgi:hypothetical protein
MMRWIADRTPVLHAVLLVMLWSGAAGAHAAVAGVVVKLSGAMSARGAGGTLKPLAPQSEVAGGDTLVTGAQSYALVRFIDNSEMTLRPNTTLAIDGFSFDGAHPETDHAAYTLVKGGLRSITGLLGKRSKEKFTMKTPSATIGIRGTTFFLEVIGAAGEDAASPGLDPGLHVHVSEGGISLVNDAGQFQYDPGQFGYIKDYRTKPVKMFANPGMRFAPPPGFGDGTVLP